MTGNSSRKIFVSYKIAIAYAIFIAIATVLVGVLSALVNPPECNNNKSTRLSQTLPKASLRENKSSYDILKYLLRNKKSDYVKELDRCEELNQPTDGQLWESLKLPKNIIPIKYGIKLFTPVFAADSYSGEIKIEIEVVQPTQFIILNAKFLSVYLASLIDMAGNQIELACDGLFLPNDYYVLKTKNELSSQKYLLDLYFTGNLNIFSSGIFEIKYNNDDKEFDGSMLASHFEPLDARKGYPCFDEPQLKAKYVIEIYHPNGTQALSNWPVDSESAVNDGEILTIFKETPRLPSYLIGLTVFNKSDFTFKEKMTDKKIPIKFWARKSFVNNGLIDDPLQMTFDLFNSLEKIFSDVPDAIPPKIDVFAIPFYPQDAVPHSGLILFEENKVLFKKSTVQERVRQSITLEMAKLISEFWFGNYMTFEWWSELWLQESLADFMKYKVVDMAYPDWRVVRTEKKSKIFKIKYLSKYDQFITEELIQVLTEDSYPSSHPVIKQVYSPTEIDELFDDIESSKGAAILRMMEYEIGSFDFMLGIKNYLKQSQNGIGKPEKLWEVLDNIRNWPAKDFAERWFTQANYPFVKVRMIKKEDDKFYIDINQERFKSDYSIFSNEDLYPTVFNYTWYIPLRCIFGRSPTDPEPIVIDFQIDTKQYTQIIGDGNTEFNWFHCDERFAGYYLLDYSKQNWENLGLALKQHNEYLEASDRSNLIHNLFINTFNGKTSYKILTDFLSYLVTETEYLPWKTVHKHVSDLAAILEYRRSFYSVSQYFVTMLQEIEHSTNIWEASSNHIEELKREIILELSCRMLDSSCLKNVTSLWPQAFDSLISSTNQYNLAPHVKQIVYNYHLQNTYSINEWQIIFLEYQTLEDIQEREMLLEAISYSRLPSLLSKFLTSVSDDQFRREDYFDIIRFLGKNPIGREIAWDFYRSKFVEINTLFGFENINIGKMLLYITSTFSDEFMYFELLDFIYNTQSGASLNARLRSIEIVSTNLVWIVMKEEEIIQAFTGGRLNQNYSLNNSTLIDLKQKLRNAYNQKFDKNPNQKSLEL